jgi:2-dehydropantoate 2-reductase
MSPFASLTQGARVSDQQESAARLHKELSRGGFEARHSDDVIGAMWEKWVLLATLAGSTCLMRASIGEIVRTDTGAQLISKMLDECAAVATASDHPPRSVALSIVRPTLTDPESQISASMLRDIQRGGQIEAEHIVGDLIRRGREHGVPTPLLEIAYVHLQAYQNRMKSAQAAT